MLAVIRHLVAEALDYVAFSQRDSWVGDVALSVLQRVDPV